MNTAPKLHPPLFADDLRRRAIIRSAAAAVREVAPLSVIDPRGIIFDPAPDGTPTLRVRGEGTAHVLVPTAQGPIGLSPEWRVVPLAEDEGLPAARDLLGESTRLAALVGLSGALRCDVLTHRLGRRAVLRVTSEEETRCRYVKILSPKAYRRAIRSLSALRGEVRGQVVRPALADDALSLLVFEEVEGVALHDALWAAQPIDLEGLLDGVRAFASHEPPPSLPERDLATERKAALRSLELAGLLVDALAPLEGAVHRVESMPLPGRGLLHGDLHDKQIFVSYDALRLIDVDGVAAGSPLIDLVNLVEHVRLRGAQGCPRGPSLAARLEARADLDDRDPGVRLLRGLIRARLAGVYGRRPWWWSLAAELAREAAALLESPA